jgi:hypothetical protein
MNATSATVSISVGSIDTALGAWLLRYQRSESAKGNTAAVDPSAGAIDARFRKDAGVLSSREDRQENPVDRKRKPLMNQAHYIHVARTAK